MEVFIRWKQLVDSSGQIYKYSGVSVLALSRNSLSKWKYAMFSEVKWKYLDYNSKYIHFHNQLMWEIVHLIFGPHIFIFRNYILHKFWWNTSFRKILCNRCAVALFQSDCHHSFWCNMQNQIFAMKLNFSQWMDLWNVKLDVPVFPRHQHGFYKI